MRLIAVFLSSSPSLSAFSDFKPPELAAGDASCRIACVGLVGAEGGVVVAAAAGVGGSAPSGDRPSPAPIWAFAPPASGFTSVPCLAGALACGVPAERDGGAPVSVDRISSSSSGGVNACRAIDALLRGPRSAMTGGQGTRGCVDSLSKILQGIGGSCAAVVVAKRYPMGLRFGDAGSRRDGTEEGEAVLRGEALHVTEGLLVMAVPAVVLVRHDPREAQLRVVALGAYEHLKEHG